MMNPLRNISIALFLIITVDIYSCSGYKKLSVEYNDESKLITFVNPDKAYTYWEFDRGVGSHHNEILFSKGKKPNGVVFQSRVYSKLFQGCAPGFCFKYIVYVYNGKVGYVTNTKELKDFLGNIDNLYEAVLLARATNEYQVDDNIKGGAYQIKSDTIYNLRLTRSFGCPDTKKTFYLKIEKSKGIVDTATLTTFYKGTGCEIY